MHFKNYDVSYLTSSTVKKNGNALFSIQTTISNSFDLTESIYYKEEVKWIFKNALADNGVYISNLLYSKLKEPASFELKLSGSDIWTSVVINGVYNKNKDKKYIFYGSEEFIDSERINVNSKLLDSVNDITDKISTYYFVSTNNNIKAKELKIIKNIFEKPTTAIDSYTESTALSGGLYEIINQLILVVVISSILGSAILFYQYQKENFELMKTYNIFYANKKRFSLCFLDQ